MIRRIIIPISLLFLVCAKQGFPPGGPEDKTPPEVLRTIPEMGATRVDRTTDVQIWFNESVRHSAAKDAVFITPNPRGEVKFKWRSKQLKIQFPDTLQSDRTYVITFGTGIQDYRNNAMAESYILAFSTGDSLDRGEITGRVMIDESASGIGVWAYSLTSEKNPDPHHQEPDYIVQCGEKGDFAFSHLAMNTYRLFAVRDRLADRLYRPVEDGIGMTYQDIDLLKMPKYHGGPVYFRMTREDTLAPRLSRANAPHANLISVQFNEPVIVTDSVLFNLKMETSDSAASKLPIKLIGYYQDPELKQWLHLIPERPMDETQYRLNIQGIQDQAGYSIDTAFSSIDFVCSALPDTTAPELVSVKPGHRARHVSVNPQIEIVFSEAMDSTSWSSHITLTDTGQVTIPLLMTTMEHARWVLEPYYTLQSELKYQLNIDSLAADLSGNTLFDTTLQFSTLNVDTLSEISGEVIDPDTIAQGDIYLLLQEIGKESRSYQIQTKKPGAYQFQSIFPGLYTIWAFRDGDDNGKYSHGRPYPYVPAERFITLPDTIKARSRWSNAGNDFSLP
ncbi:Ig-like domain-containing protein [bacterium]